MKPDEMGHAFVFCSKVKDVHKDDLMTLLYNVKEHIKDPSVTDIVEKQSQSLVSFFPIEKLMCKLISFLLLFVYCVIYTLN